MSTIQSFINKAKNKLPGFNDQPVWLAYQLVEEMYKDELILKKISYTDYVLDVLERLLPFRPDSTTLLTAILIHVWNKDRSLVKEEIFGQEVMSLLQLLSKMEVFDLSAGTSQSAVTIRKLFLNMAQDVRVMMIRLLDRLFWLEKLSLLPADTARRLAQESLNVYAPIATRLGIFSVKTELEDLAFKYLSPKEFHALYHQLENYKTKRAQSINDIQFNLEEILHKEKIEALIKGRVKHVYSIYQKLQRKNKTTVDELMDIFAVRVILPDHYENQIELVGDCYNLLGVLHNYFVPLPGSFKDYISLPKLNGYRSLHTTVFGLDRLAESQPTEVQIRTEFMDYEAEYGIAAHWLYEESKNSLAVGNKHYLTDFIRNYKAWIGDKNPLPTESRFLKNLADFQAGLDRKVDSPLKTSTVDFSDRVFVLTPTGEVKDLPMGSTPVDFAYAVDSYLGNTCSQARVDGDLAPLDCCLKTGQVVEIISKLDAKPSRFWLSFIKTDLAKSTIHHWFANSDRQQLIKEGKVLLNEHLEKIGQPLLDTSFSLLRYYDDRELSMKEREEILFEMATGALPVTAVLKNILLKSPTAQIPKLSSPRVLADANLSEAILIQGQTGLPFKFSACCKPKKLMSLIGYITRGKGVSIHVADCRMIKNLSRERLIEARWKDERQHRKIPMVLEIDASASRSVIADVTRLISHFKAIILDFSPAKSSDRKNCFKLAVEFSDSTKNQEFLMALKNVEGVKRVVTANNSF